MPKQKTDKVQTPKAIKNLAKNHDQHMQNLVALDGNYNPHATRTKTRVRKVWTGKTYETREVERQVKQSASRQLRKLRREGKAL